MYTPSIITHVVSSAFILFAVLVTVVSYDKILKLDIWSIIILLLLYALVIGVHAISHLGLEKEYKYLLYTGTDKK